MCFFGGGGSKPQAAPILFNTPTQVSPEIPKPKPISQTYKPLIDEFSSASVRQAGRSKKRDKPSLNRRQSLSSGVSIASNTNTPSGGINL